MKRKISVLLAGAVAISMLASCGGEAGGDSEKGGNDTSAEVTTAKEPTVYDYLPEKDYGGRSYHILTSEGWSVDMLTQMYIEEETGDVVGDAVYRRNRTVEEAFNVEIECRTVTYGNLVSTIRQEVQAGETNTDLISHAPTQLAPLSAEGVFFDIQELPYMDMSQKWYVGGVNEELQTRGKQYLFLTDLGFVYASAVNMMLYNRDMAEELKIDNLQKIALDGKWTLDAMAKTMKNIYKDLNGNGTADMGDRFAISVQWNEMTATIPYSLGQKITELDKDGYPQLVYNNERMVDIIGKLNTMFVGTQDVYTETETFKNTQIAFRDGQTLYVILNISSVTNDRMRDTAYDYAALPIPKYDEAQESYLTGISPGSATVFAVPTTTPDKEFTAVVTEALSAEGYARVIPAYIETTLKVKLSNDEESKEVYDLILNGRTIDFATIWDSSGMFGIFTGMMKSGSTNFASEYASREATALAAYKKIYEQFE